MKLGGFFVDRRGKDWLSQCFWRELTDRQFTLESHDTTRRSRFILLAMCKSYLAARSEAREIRATPEGRNAAGW